MQGTATVSDTKFRLDIDQIQKFLPHRAPFLLVDRVLEIDPVGDHTTFTGEDKLGTRVVAIKNATYNEPFFQGHFPGRAITPGVLLLEMMAQAASFTLYPCMSHGLDRVPGEFQCILVGVDGARFRRPVVPGDTLRIETRLTRCRGKLWTFECSGTVDGQRTVEAEILANLITSSGSPRAGR